MKALFVVEPKFLEHHVGVRRVIDHYCWLAEEAGYTAVFAAPVDGELRTCAPADIESAKAALEIGRQDYPVWTSDNPILFQARPRRTNPAARLAWADERVYPEQFEVSIITNPWLCAGGLPSGRYSIGIMYDLVPNLLACGVIHFGVFADAARFAQEHDAGFRFYIGNCDRILAISQSTCSDFERFYRPLLEDRRAEVMIPFQPGSQVRVKARPCAPGERFRLLLVNVLDVRKNFRTAAKALEKVKACRDIDIDVVGRERGISQQDALDFLKSLTRGGGQVNWFREASDSHLASLYADADLLLFPSIYEGLGLPILEAQAHGTPVISSGGSSCGEINLNQDLVVEDHHDAHAFAQKVIGVIDRTLEYKEGRPLREALDAYIEPRNRLTWPQASSAAENAA